MLDISFGHYKFFLPIELCPDYERFELGKLPYRFFFNLHISSNRKIRKLSVPENTSKIRNDDNGKGATIRTQKPCREFLIYYQTIDMLYPQLQYAEHPDY